MRQVSLFLFFDTMVQNASLGCGMESARNDPLASLVPMSSSQKTFNIPVRADSSDLIFSCLFTALCSGSCMTPHSATDGLPQSCDLPQPPNTLRCFIDWAGSVGVLSVICVCNALVCLSQLHQWRWGRLTQGRC